MTPSCPSQPLIGPQGSRDLGVGMMNVNDVEALLKVKAKDIDDLATADRLTQYQTNLKFITQCEETSQSTNPDTFKQIEKARMENHSIIAELFVTHFGPLNGENKSTTPSVGDHQYSKQHSPSLPVLPTSDDHLNKPLPPSPKPSANDQHNLSQASTSYDTNSMDTSEAGWQRQKNSAKRLREPLSPMNFEHPTKIQVLNPDENLDKNDTTNENDFQTITSRPCHIPPIIMENPQFKWTEVRKALLTVTKSSFSGKKSGENFILRMTTENDHRAATNLLDNRGIEHFTYSYESLNPLKAVIKNMPADIPTDEIKSALEAEGLPIINVHQLKKTVDGVKIPLPIFFLELTRDDNGKRIFNLEFLLNIKITVDSYQKGDHITQCHRCQQYGHGQRNCRMQPRCVKCAGNHLTKDHVGPKKVDNPKCALCDGPHVASYRQCPMRPLPKPREEPTRAPTQPPPTVDAATFPQVSPGATPPPETPTWTQAARQNREPTAQTSAAPSDQQSGAANSSEASQPNQNTNPTFDIRALLTRLTSLWQRFKAAQDIITKIEIGFEAASELINIINYG